MLDCLKPISHKKLIEKELEGFGIRLNKRPPGITFRRKDKGGVSLTTTISEPKLDLECESPGFFDFTFLSLLFFVLVFFLPAAGRACASCNEVLLGVCISVTKVLADFTEPYCVGGAMTWSPCRLLPFCGCDIEHGRRPCQTLYGLWHEWAFNL